MREDDFAAAQAGSTASRTEAPVARRGARLALAALALLLIVLFAGLGTWQVFRLQWKLDLIARVDARVHAEPAPPPTAAAGRQLTAAADEYRRLRLSGSYLYDLTTPVQALTEQGSGYWLLTPLCVSDGQIILVNRGFIPATPGERTRYDARRAGSDVPAGADPCAKAGPPVTITGLLRVSERGGPFTRANDPGAGRWFSRDAGAIAAARGLPRAAPYFVDAAAGQNAPGAPDAPQGGLTVVSFANNHLGYALTWYALAAMVAGAWWWVAHGAARRTARAAGMDADERGD
ncbi:SURF1 family protein [Massilia forsythiae]|uniref:SURF1-like protein n=1 Tax=Massilia forsythiae TaxID=2728020 RepID=A0A7Z2VZF1_9BURK|nr:SURF1 family protein [Massilia forsythiae]QJE02237.1 SURF1 family protein [Massilia forsythiae]